MKDYKADNTVQDPPAAAGAPRRMRIDVGAPLDRKEDDAWEAVVAANDRREPRVMLRGSELVRATDDGLEPFRPESLRRRVSQVAAFGREGKEGDWQPKDPPLDVVKGLIARHGGEYPGAPHVDRVLDVPALDADRQLISEAGHHEASRLYLRPAEGLEGVGPADEITTVDVEEAREYLLLEYLGDFGFADAGSMAHALGLLLLPFVRDAIPGGTPMHVVLAPDMGAGKTTLAQACLLPGCGVVPATAGTDSDDEWRKRITASVLGGRPAVLLDNLTGTLKSGPLAAALTSGTWADRVLGESREIQIPVRHIWTATGNNLDMASDQVRRAIPIFLDPGEVRPSERNRDAFRHPDLLGWGTKHRRELVRAALTLVEHWRRGAAVVEGGYVYLRTGEDPLMGRKTLGSFDGWAAVMGGILDACGVPGFLTNRDRLKADADGKGREVAEFLAAVHALGLPPMETADLAQALQGGSLDGKPFDRYMPADLAGKFGPDLSKALGLWIRQHKEQWHGGHKLTLDPSHRRRHWQVVRSARAGAPA
jgi:hypothetical protein